MDDLMDTSKHPYQSLTPDAVSYTHLDVYKRQVAVLVLYAVGGFWIALALTRKRFRA